MDERVQLNLSSSENSIVWLREDDFSGVPGRQFTKIAGQVVCRAMFAVRAI
jgi:hypothetical protein